MSNDRRQIVEALTEERAGLVCPAAMLCACVCVCLVLDGGVLYGSMCRIGISGICALCHVFSLLVGWLHKSRSL
jgi:hypothetical protein